MAKTLGEGNAMSNPTYFTCPHCGKVFEASSLASELGRRGGLKGGKSLAAKLTREQRIESARRASRARWDKKAANG